VISASIEKRELSADPGLMRELAETSGGAVVEARDVARMPDVVKRWERPASCRTGRMRYGCW